MAREEVVRLEELRVRVKEGCEQRPLWFGSVHLRSVANTNICSQTSGRPVAPQEDNERAPFCASLRANESLRPVTPATSRTS